MGSSVPQSVLCADFGNTRAKWVLYDQNALALKAGADDTARVESLGVSDWLVSEVLPMCTVGPDAIVVSSVRGGGIVQACRALATQLGCAFFNPTATSGGQGSSRLVTAYENPQLLGQDRWSACYAVACQSSLGANLVVSFGTATTVDALVRLESSQGGRPGFLHLGGYIVPGVATMLQSLHQQTAQLPLVSLCQTDWPVSTAQAIGAGVFEAQRQLILAARNRLQGQTGQSVGLWLTGGASEGFSEAFEAPVNVLPEAVLQGLFMQFKAQSECGAGS